MPIISPLTTLKDPKVSMEVIEKPIHNNRLPLGVDMSNASSPHRTSKFESDPSPSKLVLPRKVDDDSSTTPSEDYSEDASTSKIVKTEHKLFEESDAFEEPLLKENPHRFVLFPIQDNDVRITSHDVIVVGKPMQVNPF